MKNRDRTEISAISALTLLSNPDSPAIAQWHLRNHDIGAMLTLETNKVSGLFAPIMPRLDAGNALGGLAK